MTVATKFNVLLCDIAGKKRVTEEPRSVIWSLAGGSWGRPEEDPILAAEKREVVNIGLMRKIECTDRHRECGGGFVLLAMSYTTDGGVLGKG